MPASEPSDAAPAIAAEISGIRRRPALLAATSSMDAAWRPSTTADAATIRWSGARPRVPVLERQGRTGRESGRPAPAGARAADAAGRGPGRAAAAPEGPAAP